MPVQKISQDQRAAVIEDWLDAKSRDEIAHDNLLGAGSVSSIISEYKKAQPEHDADDLRELGLKLRKSRFTAPECAFGFRPVSIMKKRQRGSRSSFICSGRHTNR